jgi:hypothetical protein
MADTQESYVNQLGALFGLSFDGDAGFLGSVVLDDIAADSEMTAGVASVWAPNASSLVTTSVDDYLATYGGYGVIADTTWGLGHVVGIASNDIFSNDAFAGIGDPEEMLRDNEYLWINMVEVAGDCGDGVPCGEDCDDTDPEVHPGAEDICNYVDDDCDGDYDEDCYE